MATKKYKVYRTELVNGSKGNIAIPVDSVFVDILHSRVFMEDEYSDMAIRTDSVIKYEFVGYE